MERSYVLVPFGMSYINAYYALYTRANRFEEDVVTCIGPEDVNTPEKVARIFRNFPDWLYPTYYIDNEGGKFLGVGFATFPILEVKGYDKCYGEGRAFLALKIYDEKVNSKDRFDKWDCYRFKDLLSNEAEEKAWG